MDVEAFSQRLRALAADHSKRSKAAHLRAMYMDVEAALAAGVRRSAVIEALCECGLPVSAATFDTTLQRIRTKYKVQTAASGQPERSVKSDTIAAPTSALLPRPSSPAPSYDPSVIDRIRNQRVDFAALSKLAKAKRD